jgi:hypothetical protein
MAKAARGARYDDVERFAMALPEVTQAPHHHFGSWRVRGKIFVTVPPGGMHLHVFIPDVTRPHARSARCPPRGPVHLGNGPAADRRDQFLELHAGFCERLLWGGKVVGLRVTLAAADRDVVCAMVRLAWEAKAPKGLLGK